MANEDARLVTLYMSISATMILIIICIVEGEIALPKTNTGWISLIISHVFYAYAMIAFFISISLIGAGETTFYNNIEPIMAVGVGFLFLGQNLSVLQYVGILIVLTALLYNGKKRPNDQQPHQDWTQQRKMRCQIITKE
jgi:drug/metabolite transporter (DMT)-like permease